jgi:hypothetical protein
MKHWYEINEQPLKEGIRRVMDDDENDRPKDSSGPTEMDGEPDDIGKEEEEDITYDEDINDFYDDEEDEEDDEDEEEEEEEPHEDWKKVFAIPYKLALKKLDDVYEKGSEDLPTGSGAFEEWYLGLSNVEGPKSREISSTDIDSLSASQVINLFTNIFYNKPTTLKTALDKAALTTLITRAVEEASQGIYNNPKEDLEWLASELAQGWIAISEGKGGKYYGK